MQADVGQGKLGVPSDHFFHLHQDIMAQAKHYVGAIDHLQGTGRGCNCGSIGAHEKTRHLLWQELIAFEAAVSGENRIIHHVLHWHGFTQVHNTLVPTTTVPAMRYYCLIMLKESNGIYGGGDSSPFCLPYPCGKLTSTWARKTCLTQSKSSATGQAMRIATETTPFPPSEARSISFRLWRFWRHVWRPNVTT